jgi:hypothetical protein
MQQPHAATAGEQNHSDPWSFTGGDADAPEDTGKPPVVPNGPVDIMGIAEGAAVPPPGDMPALGLPPTPIADAGPPPGYPTAPGSPDLGDDPDGDIEGDDTGYLRKA